MSPPATLRAVVISPLSPIPPIHGNCRRLAALLEWLKEQKFHVTLVVQPIQALEGNHHHTRQLVDELIVVPPPETSLRQRLRDGLIRVQARTPVFWRLNRYLERPTVVRDADSLCEPATRRIVRQLLRKQRPTLLISFYMWFSPCLASAPRGTLKVIDTVEVFQRDQASRVSLVSAVLQVDAASEQRALRRADILIAIQDHDRATLSAIAPGTRIVTARHAAMHAGAKRTPKLGHNVLFVGSNNPYNQAGLEHFLREVWPNVLSVLPDARLDVVGSLSEQMVGTAHGVTFHGRVTDEELADFYATTGVVVVPLIAGTGLKIKCVEALAAGCPVVTTPPGAEGLEDGAGRAFLVASNVAEFGGLVVDLLRNQSRRVQFEREALAFAARALNPVGAFAELAATLREAGVPISSPDRLPQPSP